MAGVRRHPPGFGAKAGAPPTWAFGFNLRPTETHDNAHLREDGRDIWFNALDIGNKYPTSLTNGNGLTVTGGLHLVLGELAGYTFENSGATYAGQDARLAGHLWINRLNLPGQPFVICIEVPGSGNYEVEVGMARRSTPGSRVGGYALYQRKSDAVSDLNRLALNEGDFPADGVLDAAEVVHASAAIWAASQTRQAFTITTQDPDESRWLACLRFLQPTQLSSGFAYLNHCRFYQV